MRTRILILLAALSFLRILPAFAAESAAKAAEEAVEEPAAAEAVAEPAAEFVEDDATYGVESLTSSGSGNSDSSVNISEEYGFGRRQNIDSFLGEYENPFAPLPEDATYKGSRSEFRDEIKEHRI